MNLSPPGSRRLPGTRRRSRAALASGALLLAVLTASAGQNGSALAATPPAATTTGPTAASKSAAADAPRGTVAGPDPAAKPDVKAAAEAAARSLRASDPTGPCPSTLKPHEVVTCDVPTNTEVRLGLTLPQPKDLLLIQAIASEGGETPRLLAPDGAPVTCTWARGYSGGALQCPTASAGAYTLAFTNHRSSGIALSAAYTPLLSTTACTPVGPADTRLGAPTVFRRSLPLGSSGDCYTLDTAAGEMLRSYTGSYQVLQGVYDATGKEVCSSRDRQADALDCRLDGTAPFRMAVLYSHGSAGPYEFTAARLSRPEGCPVVEPQPFGVSADTTGTARCRLLRVPTAGAYALGPVSAGSAPYGTLLTAEGTAPGGCNTAEQGVCELPAGDHTWVVDPRTADGTAFGMSFRSTRETRGCAPTHDNGLVAGAATGTFTGPGQHFCLTLPTATGQGLYLLNRPPAGGDFVAAAVYDASGAKQCAGSPEAVCKLTGTAPFRVVLGNTEPEAYGLVIHRTGDAAGCTAWPQTPFGSSSGAQVQLSDGVRQACLSLPADRHSVAETVDYANPRNQRNADVKIVDPQGNVACAADYYSSATCRLTAGVPYTALLIGTHRTGAYTVVRRDVSATATCTTPVSTKVGGPSTPFDLTSALDAACIRVTAEAADKMWFSARTRAGRYDPTTKAVVIDSTGKIVCHQFGISCQVTGSTSYVILVATSKYDGRPIHTDVDTWRVGTAAGWAPECAASRVSVDGFPARSGVLSESSTAYCAVIDMKENQSFRVVGTSSATDGEHPWTSLLSASWNPDSPLACTGSLGAFQKECSARFGAPAAGEAVLLLSPGTAATPVEFSMQGVCRSACTRPPLENPTGISPASGPAGTRSYAVVTGTGLTLGTRLKLISGDSPAGELEAVSVNPEGTELKVAVNTTGLEPGAYDLLLDGAGYTDGEPSPGYLPKAYTVTAAAAVPQGSRFVPMGPSRFLDTRDGTGAPRQRVGPGGVVSLQVAGVKGVPASRVTAVVMNVTAVDPTESGHVTVYPNGQAAPQSSNLNFTPGRIVPNLVTVPVVNGKVDLRNSAGTVDLIADVSGYYTDKAGVGSALNPITPSRFLDTRDGTGAPRQRVGPGGVVTLQVAGVAAVPAKGVTAVVMNVTAVEPTESGHVTVYPNGQAAPQSSNLNFTPGQVVPNLVTVPVVNGKVDLRNSAGSVDLIADVTGYYAAAGAAFSAAGPVRLLDTRDGTGARSGAVGPGGLVSVRVSGVAGVPAQGVKAVVLNVTATNPTEAGHLVVHPHGTGRPSVSNLNYTPGSTVANLVVVPVVDGRVTFWNNTGSVDVVADLNGYFTS
ncbi:MULTISPECIES: hypothetical protein [Streptomyces]|uniref:hypothetical protein n=1 Tax=Streptomyces TaxID=1883 RepID=UPI00167BDEBB|nr:MULTISPECIES: hypothetical protein [Streptomyces]MBD3575498.1 hypothetical protein [Streptomyces sp. KD18]GGT22459.1 hypothetical protein GCM10010286_55010 [Streptomyces toxytricini]